MGGGGGGGSGFFFFVGGGGGQVGCERERRIEVIVKIQKKNRGRGVRSGWMCT